jgi:chitinase
MRLAPYVYTWGNGTSSYALSTLVSAQKQLGLAYATLAFIVSGMTVTTSIGDEQIADIKAFIAAGGKPILSFGGADGTYIEQAITDDTTLFNYVDNILQLTGIWSIDFDIENASLSDTSITTRRNTLIKSLQKKYPGLYVSFTLAVDTTGLPAAGLAMVKQVWAEGVAYDIINIMTMDYGSLESGKTLGQMAIESAEAVVSQLGLPYSKLGICPMIGLNDDKTTFSLSDAKTVAAYASLKNIGLISYWALQRDQAGTGDNGLYSQVNSGTGDFFKIFNVAVNATPGPTVVVPVVPAAAPVVVSDIGTECPNCNKRLKLTLA